MLRQIREDAPSLDLESRIDPRTGALVLRYAPTWIGVQEYRQEDGSISRELHRPEQVWSDGFLATVRRLTQTLDHPSAVQGDRRVPGWVNVDPDYPAPPGYVTVTPAQVGIGLTGDVVEPRPAPNMEGVDLPTLLCTITDQRVIDLIVKGGMRESSLGYDTFVDRTPGVWIAPDGTEHPYDAEHVLDPADPRIAKAIADGKMTEAQAATLGANHFAVLFRGRGKAQSALRLDGQQGPTPMEDNAIPLRTDLEEPRRFYFERREDVNGKSGTGRVADGIRWGDGRITIRWRTECASTTDFDCLEDFERIHGHEGRGVAIWVDPAPTPGVNVEVEVEIAGPGAGFAGSANRIGDVSNTAPKITVVVPERLRRSDAMASFEIPDDPSLKATLEAMFLSFAEAVRMSEAAQTEAEAGMAAAEGAQAEAAMQLESMGEEMKALQEDAREGRALRLRAAQECAKRLGLTPTGDSAEAVQEEVVKAKVPGAIEGLKSDGDDYRAAIKAAFRAVDAFHSATPTPAKPLPGPARPLVADAEDVIPTPKTPRAGSLRARAKEMK